MLSKIKNKWLGLLLSFVAFFVCLFLSSLFSKTAIYQSLGNGFLAETAGELLFTVLALVFAFLFRKKDLFRFTKKGIFSGIMADGFHVVLFLTVLALAVAGIENYKVSVPCSEIVYFVIFLILVGISEETLCRGLIENAFHDLFGLDNLKHTYLAIYISGVCFGLFHLTNAISPDISFTAAAFQSLTAIPGGLLLSAVYFRSRRNIWISALLHAMIDASGLISMGSLSGNSLGESLNSFSYLAIFTFLFYMAIVLFVLRPKKLRPALADIQKEMGIYPEEGVKEISE